MTRVTFGSYDDDPPQGGQGVYLHGLRGALVQRGLRVHTISGRGDHAIAFARRTGRAPLDFSLQLNRYPRILVRASPDVVHLSGGPGGVLFWKPLEMPIVYTAHHTYRQAHTRGMRRMLGGLEARCYARAAMVLPVSPSTADALLRMGIAASRIEIVPPGIAVHDTAGVEREAGRILFAGRLEPEKGVLDAIRAMGEVAERRGGAHGVVIGAGSQASAVRRLVAASGGRIEFQGTVDDAALQREMARASVLLMPSRYEGLGLVALEAQAAGTPVVAYDVDGLRDAVRDGGVRVRSGDVAALSAACVALLDNPERRDDLGARGRETVLRNHSWDTVAARMLEIYASVGAPAAPQEGPVHSIS